MLRAVRYEQRNGFQIEARTLALLQEALPLIARVTGERLRAELEHVLEEPQYRAMLTRLDGLGLLQAIHPDLALDSTVLPRLAVIPGAEPDPVWGLGKSSRHGWATQKRLLAYMAWLMPLPSERAQEILDRLATPRGEAQTILAACSLYTAIPQWIQRQTVELVEALDEYDLLVIYAVSLLAPEVHCREALAAYLLHMRYVYPNITGDELRRRGIPPSPVYKQILRALRHAWLEGQVTDDAQELALLEDLLRTLPTKGQEID
jgi:tRNA nucleotidyltransferase (CCA-adding enzyme)